MAADGEAAAADLICRVETRLVIKTKTPESTLSCLRVLVAELRLRPSIRHFWSFGLDSVFGLQASEFCLRRALAAAQPSPSRHYLHSTALGHRFKRFPLPCAPFSGPGHLSTTACLHPTGGLLPDISYPAHPPALKWPPHMFAGRHGLPQTAESILTTLSRPEEANIPYLVPPEFPE